MKRLKLNEFRKKNQNFSTRLKTNDSKNQLLSEFETLFPFATKKGEKKKIKNKFYKVIENRQSFSNDNNFNSLKFQYLDEMVSSNTPYVNFVSTNSKKGGSAKQQAYTVPIKKQVQKRLKTSWLFLDIVKKKSPDSFENDFLNKIKLWENNKEKVLQNRNNLYKTTLQHQQDDDD